MCHVDDLPQELVKYGCTTLLPLSFSCFFFHFFILPFPPRFRFPPFDFYPSVFPSFLHLSFLNFSWHCLLPFFPSSHSHVLQSLPSFLPSSLSCFSVPSSLFVFVLFAHPFILSYCHHSLFSNFPSPLVLTLPLIHSSLSHPSLFHIPFFLSSSLPFFSVPIYQSSFSFSCPSSFLIPILLSLSFSLTHHFLYLLLFSFPFFALPPSPMLLPFFLISPTHYKVRAVFQI